MLDRQEQFCKWSLFVLLVASLILPGFVIHWLDLIHTVYVFEGWLFVFLIATSIQAIPGLIGWSMLCRYNEKGKRVIQGTYLTTMGIYGIFSLFLQVTLLFPKFFIIYPLEYVSIHCLFGLSVLVFVLQRLWTRYVF